MARLAATVADGGLVTEITVVTFTITLASGGTLTGNL